MPNLAPYSFFNAIGNDPPMIVLGLVAHPTKGTKDTAANIRETGNFIVHLVDEAHAERMNHTSIDHPAGVDEGALVGLDMVPGVAVAAPASPARRSASNVGRGTSSKPAPIRSQCWPRSSMPILPTPS
ncbi:hypothetical protein GCM10020258_33010 [Sphingomonas yabuuchiae]